MMRLQETTGRLKLSNAVSQFNATLHKRHRIWSTEACTKHLSHPKEELASFALSKVESMGPQTDLKAASVS